MTKEDGLEGFRSVLFIFHIRHNPKKNPFQGVLWAFHASSRIIIGMCSRLDNLAPKRRCIDPLAQKIKTIKVRASEASVPVPRGWCPTTTTTTTASPEHASQSRALCSTLLAEYCASQFQTAIRGRLSWQNNLSTLLFLYGSLVCCHR